MYNSSTVYISVFSHFCFHLFVYFHPLSFIYLCISTSLYAVRVALPTKLADTDRTIEIN